MVALNESSTNQVIVVVDDDIDVFNEKEVVWALATMVNPERDVTYIRNLYTIFTTAMGHNKLVIDATRPLDRPFPTMLKVPEQVLKSVIPEQWLD